MKGLWEGCTTLEIKRQKIISQKKKSIVEMRLVSTEGMDGDGCYGDIAFLLYLIAESTPPPSTHTLMA